MKYFLLTLGFLAFTSNAFAVEIRVLSQYDYEPWVVSVEKRQGILFDLVEQLNLSFKNKATFKLTLLPRKRLTLELEKDPNIIIPFVDPRFFNDVEKLKYDWTSSIFKDSSFFASHIDTKIEFETIKSFFGKTLSSTSGHVYKDLEAYIENGSIKKIDSNTYSSSLKMLLNKRAVDFLVVDSSFIFYMKNHSSVGYDLDKLFISPNARMVIERRILIPKKSKLLKKDFEIFIKEIKHDSKWKNLLNFE